MLMLRPFSPSRFSASLPPVVLLLFVAVTVHASTNFDQCLQDVRNGLYGPNAGVDNQGRPVSDIKTATAIPYGVCVTACGAGPAPFSWSNFSNQFAAWLLPWLALLSQLPFGANDKLKNFLGVVLTVGSPTLAAYSVALTVLNGRWITRLRGFYESDYPNTNSAIRIFSSLQQSPIRLNLDGALLSSLVVLPENDEWWKELLEHIDYTHTWSISAVTSIVWVLIAYIFTVIDSLSNVLQGVEVNGQAVGSVWLWLLPIVVVWLQISPKCDSKRVKSALKRANDIARVATDKSGKTDQLSLVSNQRAVYLLQKDDSVLYDDEQCSAPVYNYARLFSWTAAVEEVSNHFYEAAYRAKCLKPVSLTKDDSAPAQWVHDKQKIDENRVGTASEVMEYCSSNGEHGSRSVPWGSRVRTRIVAASLCALLLQWGTTGAAVFVLWQTPTHGLGCRSGSYLLYAMVSTIVWAMLLLSSILSNHATTRYTNGHKAEIEKGLDSSPEGSADPNDQSSRLPLLSRIGTTDSDSTVVSGKEKKQMKEKHHHLRPGDSMAGKLSIFLRRLGKILATMNAIWIIATCIFQFSAFFDRCYCDSSALGLGTAKAYNVIQFLDGDLSSMRAAWIGGVFLATGSAVVYVIVVNIFIVDPVYPL